jgi:hypothetical protein
VASNIEPAIRNVKVDDMWWSVTASATHARTLGTTHSPQHGCSCPLHLHQKSCDTRKHNVEMPGRQLQTLLSYKLLSQQQQPLAPCCCL